MVRKKEITDVWHNPYVEATLSCFAEKREKQWNELLKKVAVIFGIDINGEHYIYSKEFKKVKKGLERALKDLDNLGIVKKKGRGKYRLNEKWIGAPIRALELSRIRQYQSDRIMDKKRYTFYGLNYNELTMEERDKLEQNIEPKINKIQQELQAIYMNWVERKLNDFWVKAFSSKAWKRISKGVSDTFIAETLMQNHFGAMKLACDEQLASGKQYTDEELMSRYHYYLAFLTNQVLIKNITKTNGTALDSQDLEEIKSHIYQVAKELKAVNKRKFEIMVNKGLIKIVFSTIFPYGVMIVAMPHHSPETDIWGRFRNLLSPDFVKTFVRPDLSERYIRIESFRKLFSKTPK